ncbi:hypothetical protein [Paenibacillus odorifer]|nr:hypothetical protein [Paenibacillus odorifer]
MSLQEKMEALYIQRKQTQQRKPKQIIMQNVALQKGEYVALANKNISVM